LPQQPSNLPETRGGWRRTLVGGQPLEQERIIQATELRDGALCVSEEAKRRQLTTWIDTEIADFFYNRTLPLTVDILLDWIGLARTLRLKGRTRDPTDLLMAATARVHDLILVSRNVRHFADTGIVIYDPWNDQTHQTEM
jgi:toxin FitB